MPVTVITGPPCSGKSTYVHERAKPGDIIVDLDAIAHALTGADTPSHQYPEHIRRLAMKARWSVLRDAVSLGRQGCDAWIIDGSPSTEVRAMYRQHSAKIIALNASVPELLRRAEQANRPAHYRNLILTWQDDAAQR